MAAAATPAAADNECGAPSPIGVITCPAVTPAYGSISYTGLSGGRLLSLESGAAASSIRLSGTGALGVGASEAELRTIADDVSAIDVRSTNRGAVTVNVGDIITSGAASHGVYAETSGVVTVTSDRIETSGAGAKGIYTRNTEYAANADAHTVNSKTILTSGTDADGMDLYSLSDVSITSQTVSTTGAGARGIVANSRNNLTVNSDVVTTTGDGAGGLRLVGLGQSRVTSQSVTTSGDDSIGLLFAGSALILESDSITTTGARSHGLSFNVAAPSTVTTSAIQTSGEGARGVTVFSDNANGVFTLNSTRIETDGDDATGISVNEDRVLNPLGESTTGLAFTVNGGDVITHGDDARGIVAVNYGNFDISAHSVTTDGEGSAGLFLRGANVKAAVETIVTHGDYAPGAYLGTGGDATLSLASVTTDGRASHGIGIDAGADAVITAGTVRASGDNAHGVQATAAKDITLALEDVRASGPGGSGVLAVADGNIIATVGYVEATGVEGSGMELTAEGDLTVSVARHLAGSYNAAALTASKITFSTAAGATVEGGMSLYADTTSTLDNAGTISDPDLAISVIKGSATVNNSGAIHGRISFVAGQADVINNTGLFEMAADSEFGGGQDLFDNSATGVVRFAANNSPRSFTFLNLETFRNAGTIDLADGVAGDVLTLPGLLDNTGGGKVELDVDLTGATPTADRLLAGSLQGVGLLRVHVEGDAALGDSGITLVSSAAAQTGQEFTVETVGGGFLDYDLAFDGETNSYRLVGELAPQAFEPTMAASGAQALWRRGADMVGARLAEVRDTPLRNGRGPQFWSQAFGGDESVDLGATASADRPDLSHDIDSRGVQAGGDILLTAPVGTAVIGGLVGTARTRMVFDGNHDASTFDSLSLGVYGQWSLGALAVGGLVKGELHDMTYRWASVEMSDDADGETWGARLDISTRLPLSGRGLFLEPTASAAWSRTSLGDISGDAGEVDFGDTESLVGRAGVRLGGVMHSGLGLTVQPYGGVYALREFAADNASRLTLSNSVVEVEYDGERDWAEAILGVNVQGPGRLGGFAQIESQTGDVEGLSARVGLRFNW